MSNKRQTIIDAATRLFSAHGYRAVGIDRVVAEADVAKMTLYKHFPSKNDLILSVLHDWDGKFRKRLLSFVDGFRVPKERLAAFFSWHDRWFREPDFNGCMFISAAAEYPDNQDPIHCASMGHKRAMRGHIGTLLRDLAGSNVDTCTVDQVAQILDGAIVAAHLLGDKDAAVAAWCSAIAVLYSQGAVEADGLSVADVRILRHQSTKTERDAIHSARHS